MPIYALKLLFPLILLTLYGCESVRIVEKPVPFEVTVFERVPVPDEHLVQHPKSTIPDTLTYAEGIQLWAEDRAIIDTQNGQLEAIGVLSHESTD